MNHNVRHCELMRDNCMIISLCISKDRTREIFDHNLIKKKSDVLYDFAINNRTALGDNIKQYIAFVPKPGYRESAAQANRILEALSEELLIKQPGQSPMINALLVRLYSCFLDYPERYECRYVVLNTKSDAFVFNNITRFIEQFPGRPSRQDLAEHFNYSSDHINRIIKKHSGKSFANYVRDVSLAKAEHLLKQTDEPVSRIIAAVGFENKSYFYNYFMKKHNTTPMAYRAKYR